MTFLAETAAATVAGVVTTVVGHPLDTIKVHLQANSSAIQTTTGDAARSLWKEGALFRGILPPLCNAVVMNTVMFSVFHGIKDIIEKSDDVGGATSSPAKMSTALLAGTISGFATACISTPTDYIKIQSQLSKKGTKSWDLFLSTPTRCLFRGHMANLGREGVFTMVYLGLYNQLDPHGFWQIAVASSFTGALAWIASYPFDTLKTRVQSVPPPRPPSSSSSNFSVVNYRDTMSRIGSVSSYYRGCWASTSRAIMVTSLRMIVYETTIGYLG